MKIDELVLGQTVTARWGRAGPEDVKWGPWKDVQLHVQKGKDSKVAIIGLKGVNWAEYGPGDYARNNGGMFLVEDYYLQIQGLTS